MPKLVRIVLILVLALSALLTVAVPTAEAASVYSVSITPLNQSAYDTYCLDDTCDETQATYAVAFDVTQRVDPVTVGAAEVEPAEKDTAASPLYTASSSTPDRLSEIVAGSAAVYGMLPVFFTVTV